MHLRHVLLGLAIPLILTATILAVPSTNGKAVLDAFVEKTSLNIAQAASGNVHQIEMTAVPLSNGQLAYKMLSHEVTDSSSVTTDITSRYSTQPSIPGPVIVITEGDEVFLTIYNDIVSRPDQQVSVHVHGVHYEITSDGTLAHINMIGDQGAYPGVLDYDDRPSDQKYTYHWIAAPGTAGTWPYHDHNFGTLNGAEHKGLFGAVIVNPASGTVQGTDGNTIQTVPVSSLSKDVLLYLGDDAFWATEIDAAGQVNPLWVNPTIVAEKNTNVRFHLIALGTDMHQFKMSNYKWVDPGTTNLISEEEIGPLENHVFTITAKNDAQYSDQNVSNKLMGMKGMFDVTNSGGPSIPGPSPL